MKKKEIKDLHTKTFSELTELVRKTQRELVKVRLDHQVGKLKNFSQIARISGDLARVKTIMREVQLNEKV